MKKLFATALLMMSFSAFSNAAVIPENVVAPEVVNIKLKSYTAEDNRATLDVSLYNPNDFKLPVKEMYGDIYLNDAVIAKMEALGEKSLGPRETQIFTVPVTVKPNELTNASSKVMLTGVANYRFKGYMMSPVGEIPVEHQGQLTREQIMAFFQAVLTISQSN